MISLNTLFAEAKRLHEQGDTGAALQRLDDARKEYPRDAALHAEMANYFEALEQNDAAEHLWRVTLSLAPHDEELLLAAANFFYRSDRVEKGLALTRAHLDQASPTLRVTHATLCKAVGETDEAQRTFEDVLRAHPTHIIALSNLAGLYMEDGAYEKAIPLFRQALTQDTANAHIKMQLAHALFRAGDFAAGWQMYEARFQAGVDIRPFAGKNWKGEKTDAGQVLIWGEQGIGEHILYASMLADAAAACPAPILEVEPRLVPLFARSFPFAKVMAQTTPPSASLNGIPWQVSFGGLGALYRKQEQDFPKRARYMQADAEKTAVLRQKYQKLKKNGGKIIGISWRSKPLRQGDPKSTSLAMWENILRQDGHVFVSLQHGDIADDIKLGAANHWPLYVDADIDQQKSLDDFAAQVAAMDQVITVSNTTAHMAGALGIDTAVLLPKARGLMWHWFDSRADSPWYPSLRLLRQPIDGDWSQPLRDAVAFITAR